MATHAATFRRRISSVLAAGVLTALLAGCGVTLAGVAAPDPALFGVAGKPLGYTPSDLPIEWSADTEGDQVAKDSITDVLDFYGSWYPDVFGHAYQAPEGGYYSITPGDGNASQCMDGPDDPSVVDNAFYCGFADEVVYWQPLVQTFTEEYGDLTVGMVLAHELGHAIQGKEGLLDNRSIVTETQADCFAGTWARWVADGNSPHFAFTQEKLDTALLVWALLLPQEVGGNPDDQLAHGSAFDRVTAIQEGFENGPDACKNNFSDDRLFTQMQFDADNGSDDGQGNASYADSVSFSQTLFDQYFETVVPAKGGSWTTPKVLVGGSGEESCVSEDTVSYCPASNAVVIGDEADLRSVHDTYGDYAVVTAMGLAFSEAAIVQLGYSPDDPSAIRAASCLTGGLSSEIIQSPNDYEVILSPGDFDEATVVLLKAGQDNGLVNTGDVSAFDRMDAFRIGVAGGYANCGI